MGLAAAEKGGWRGGIGTVRLGRVLGRGSTGRNERAARPPSASWVENQRQLADAKRRDQGKPLPPRGIWTNQSKKVKKPESTESNPPQPTHLKIAERDI